MLLIAWWVGFRGPELRTNPENIRSIEPHLKSFFAAKEGQARAYGAVGQDQVPEAVWEYFAAASRGDWDEVARLYFRIASRSYHFDEVRDWSGKLPARVREVIDWALPSLARTRRRNRLETPVWQTINESYRAYEQLAAANPRFTLAFGREVVNSVPPGSILFSGTDAGRFLVTFLCEPSWTGSRSHVLSQHALADEHYRQYVGARLVDNLHLPDSLETLRAQQEYLVEARQRLDSNQLKQGEQVTLTGGQLNLSGEVWKREINAKLAKRVFDSNLSSEFFLDEEYAMDWTYPHMAPSGLIFKLCREPIAELGDATVREDRAYWTRRVLGLIGERLTAQTPIQQICAFTERVYLLRDLERFRGEVEFVQTARTWSSLPGFLGAAAVYSKARANFARLYYWRAQNSKSAGERERMLTEMDLAVRQALALCPYQPDAVYWCIASLAARRRWSDAVLVLNTARKFHPGDRRFREWAAGLEQWLEDQAGSDRLTFDRFLSNFTPPTQVFP